VKSRALLSDRRGLSPLRAAARYRTSNGTAPSTGVGPLPVSEGMERWLPMRESGAEPRQGGLMLPET